MAINSDRPIANKYKDTKFDGERAPRTIAAFVDQAALMSTTSGVGLFLSDLTKIPAKYFLEVRKGDEVIAVMKFPYDPQSVQYSRPQPTNITYTLGGVVREASSIRRHDLTLTGRSGLGRRNAYSRDGKLLYIEGEEVFQEFDEFFKRYQEICASEFGLSQNLMPSIPHDRSKERLSKYGANGQEQVYMVLRCLDEDLHLMVEPSLFSWVKSTGENRFDYQWTCQFQAYGYSTKYTNPFFFALDTVDNIMNGMAGNVSVVNNILNNVSNDYVGRVRSTIRNVAGAMQVAADFARSFDGLINNVAGIAADLADVGNSAKFIASSFEAGFGEDSTAQNFEEVWKNNLGEFYRVETKYVTTLTFESTQQALEVHSTPLIIGDDNSRDELGNIISGLTAVESSSQVLRGAIPRKFFERRMLKNENNLQNLGEYLSNEANLSKLAKGLINEPNIDDFRNDNALTYVVAENEDLLNISKKFFGDPDKWRVIADFNDFRDHRRNAEGKFIQKGQKIRIPLNNRGQTNPFGDFNDPIGIDLYMPFDDICIDALNGDISLVGNKQNIEQIIKNTLLTRRGELAGFGFGLGAIPQIGNEAYVAAILRETLIKDPRIVSVSNIVVEYEQDSVVVNCDVAAIDEITIPVKVPISGC